MPYIISTGRRTPMGHTILRSRDRLRRILRIREAILHGGPPRVLRTSTHPMTSKRTHHVSYTQVVGHSRAVGLSQRGLYGLPAGHWGFTDLGQCAPRIEPEEDLTTIQLQTGHTTKHTGHHHHPRSCSTITCRGQEHGHEPPHL